MTLHLCNRFWEKQPCLFWDLVSSATSYQSESGKVVHICWPARAWVRVAPRRTPPRHIPSRHLRWSASGSRTPAWSSSSPAGQAQSVPHALHAHTYSAHRSSCGRRKKPEERNLWGHGNKCVLGALQTFVWSNKKGKFVRRWSTNAAVIIWTADSKKSCNPEVEFYKQVKSSDAII